MVTVAQCACACVCVRVCVVLSGHTCSEGKGEEGQPRMCNNNNGHIAPAACTVRSAQVHCSV